MNENSTLTQNIEDLKYDRILAIQDRNYEEAIHVDDNMVMPQSYWTEAEPIPGNSF